MSCLTSIWLLSPRTIPPQTPTSGHTVQQMLGHIYTAFQQRRRTMMHGLGGCLSVWCTVWCREDVYAWEPRPAHVCACARAYWRGSLLFDFSLSWHAMLAHMCDSAQVCWAHAVANTSFVCAPPLVLVRLIMVRLFGEALFVHYLILISWLDESQVQRLQGSGIIQN